MKIKTYLASLTALAMVVVSNPASAGLYVFGAGGLTAHEYYNVRSAGSYEVGAGYTLPTYFGFEASKMDLGNSLISGGGSIIMSGTNFSGVLDMPLRPLFMSFRLGIYNIDATVTGTGSANSSGLSAGVLIGYQASNNITLFMNTTVYNNVVIPLGGSSYDWESPMLLSFGARVDF